MKTKQSPRRKLGLAVAGLSATAIAVACSLITVAPPLLPVRVSIFDILRHGFDNAARAEIGEALAGMYGDNFVNDEVFVNVAVRGPIGGIVILPFTKPCGETFEEAAEDDGEENDTTPPPSSGGGGGGVYFPRIPYIPGGCVGNCSGTVEVGDVKPV